MRGGSKLAETRAAPHPALRATFSPSTERRERAYFAAQSLSRVVDIAAAAEKP